MRLFITTIALCLLFSSISTIAQAKQASKKVLLDNEQVEVIRAVYPVGTESGMHTHEYSNRVVYFVKGGKLELTSNDSNKPAKVLTVADGKTLFLPATTHNVKNIGTTEVVIVETEIK